MLGCNMFALRVESPNHRVENITVNNQGRVKWPILFNNLDNPFKKAKITGLKLNNTQLYANANNFDLFNSIFIDSSYNTIRPTNDYNYIQSYFYQYLSQRLPSLNFPNIVNVNQYIGFNNFQPSSLPYYLSNIAIINNNNYTKTINLNEGESFHVLADLRRNFGVSNIFFIVLVLPANSSRLFVTLSSYNVLNVNIYFWDRLAYIDNPKIGNLYYSFELSPTNSSTKLFLAIEISNYPSTFVPLLLKFEITNEEKISISSEFLLKDSFFNNSNINIDTSV